MLETIFNVCAIIVGILYLVVEVKSPAAPKFIELVCRLIGVILIVGAVYHLCGVPFQIHK